LQYQAKYFNQVLLSSPNHLLSSHAYAARQLLLPYQANALTQVHIKAPIVSLPERFNKTHKPPVATRVLMVGHAKMFNQVNQSSQIHRFNQMRYSNQLQMANHVDDQIARFLFQT
jgi:hypothetical protein